MEKRQPAVRGTPRPRLRWSCAAVALAWVMTCAAPAAAQTPVDMESLQDEAVQWLQDYIRVNTMNPPGNEILGAEFFAEIFDAEGIEYEIAESAPGRGNIWARLEGGSDPALILLHHMDVVPADERYWTTDPLSGEIRDGYVYGRGALDTKTGGILHLATFLALHRSGTPLNRDVVFMATADEEAGGFYGAGWLVENRPELFENTGYVLNEGGGGAVVDGKVQFGVEVTQKVPYWLRLTTSGEPGHGSRPLTSSAMTEMVEALYSLRQHAFDARVIAPVDVMFKGIAPEHPEPWRTRFADFQSYVDDDDVLLELQVYQAGLHALTRNTCSMTRMEGSDKINVVSPEVSAEVDCRLLPDQDPEAFLAEMGAVLGDEVDVEVLMGFTPAVSSTDTELYRILETTMQEAFPGSSFVPQVAGGFTDSHFLRDLGIVSYGFEATATAQEDWGGVHGNDERVTEENVRRGVGLTLEIVQRLVTAREIMDR